MTTPQDGSTRWFDGVDLVDHHCHGVMERELSRADFELLITESNWGPGAGESNFDSQVGFAIRRWCAPVLDLPPHASAADYLARRAELGAAEVNRRLLAQSGIGRFVIETGYRGDEILGPEEMGERAGGRRSSRVVRLEALAEQLVERGDVSAREYAERFRAVLRAELASAIGVKSIAAYRIGLDFEAARPSEEEVRAAAEQWLSETALTRSAETDRPRLESPVLIRFGIWCAVDERAPIQFHIGYGDPDVDLHRCSPLLLSDWLRLTRESGTTVMLLHCYPFHREAGFLAQAFPHVYMDVGLAVNYTGTRSREIIGESIELAPFSRILFSSDAWGLSELYYLGALLFRRGLGAWLDEWVDRGEWSADEAERFVRMVAHENFERAYALAERSGS